MTYLAFILGAITVLALNYHFRSADLDFIRTFNGIIVVIAVCSLTFYYLFWESDTETPAKKSDNETSCLILPGHEYQFGQFSDFHIYPEGNQVLIAKRESQR